MPIDVRVRSFPNIGVSIDVDVSSVPNPDVMSGGICDAFSENLVEIVDIHFDKIPFRFLFFDATLGGVASIGD